MTLARSRDPLGELRQNLGSWVERLVEEFPGFDEDDLAAMVERKAGVAIRSDDFETIRAHYLRSKLRAWNPALGRNRR